MRSCVINFYMRNFYIQFFSYVSSITRRIFRHDDGYNATTIMIGTAVLLTYTLIKYFVYFGILPTAILNYKVTIMMVVAIINIFYLTKIRTELTFIPIKKITKFLFSIFLLLLIVSIILLASLH
jgi:hypothetical protein